MNKFMVRTLCVILSLLVSTAINKVYAANGIIAGDGSEASPYLIEDLADFLSFVNTDLPSKYYSENVYTELRTDIDLLNEGAFNQALVLKHTTSPEDDIRTSSRYVNILGTEIANASYGILYLPSYDYIGAEYISNEELVTGYSGIFNGNGYTISNLIVDSDDNELLYGGLFGKISKTGIVKNLNITDAYVYSYIGAGAICGVNEGEIVSCSVNGTVTRGTAIGGICGINKGLILESYFNGDVLAVNCSGGIAGLNYGIIDQCFTIGQIRAKSYAGGITAVNGDIENSEPGYIINSYSRGAAKAEMWMLCTDKYLNKKDDCLVLTTIDNHYYGSITALQVKGEIINSYGAMYNQSCTVRDTGSSYINHFSNMMDKMLAGDIIDSYSASTQPVASYEKSAAEMKQASTYLASNWDSDIWDISNGQYPTLKNVSDEFVDDTYLFEDHEYSIEIDYNEILSYSSETSISVEISMDDNPIDSDDITVSYRRVSGTEYCTLEYDGTLTNKNKSPLPQTVSIRVQAIAGAVMFDEIIEVTLIPSLADQESFVQKVIVKASSDRVQPKDTLVIALSDIEYPAYVTEGQVRPETITIEIDDCNGETLNGFPVTYNITEKVVNDKVKKVIIDTEKGSSIKFNLNNDSMLIKLRDVDLSGLSGYMTVKVSNDLFSAEAKAYDNADTYEDEDKDVFLRDVINGNKRLPSILNNGIADSVTIESIKSKPSLDNERGYVLVKGSFSVSDMDNFASNGFTLKWLDCELTVKNNSVFWSDYNDGSYYVTDSEQPLLYNKGSVYKTAALSRGQYDSMASETAPVIKGSFNIKTGRYSLFISRIRCSYASKSDLELELSEFNNALFDNIEN